MKRGRVFSALLALLLLLAACSDGEVPEEGEGCRLWFPVDSGQADYVHGPALAAQRWEGGQAEPEALLTALLAGPTQEGLSSPFPRGVTLRQAAWDPERPGVLQVGLSEQYSALTDISLTLADYCIVLTLSQVEGVEGVEILSIGHSANYRSHQLLADTEAVLWDELADTGP